MTTSTIASQRATRRELELAILAVRAATFVLRWGLVVIITWFGLFKFTPTEAQAIQPLLANSPFLSWLYAFLEVEGASRLIGTV